jgi:hypothetical protein
MAGTLTIDHGEFGDALPPATTLSPYAEEARDARQERMTVTAEHTDGQATGRYIVRGSGGEKTIVDMTAGACSCDAENICQHRRRVALAITYTEMPAAGDKVEGRA